MDKNNALCIVFTNRIILGANGQGFGTGDK